MVPQVRAVYRCWSEIKNVDAAEQQTTVGERDHDRAAGPGADVRKCGERTHSRLGSG